MVVFKQFWGWFSIDHNKKLKQEHSSCHLGALEPLVHNFPASPTYQACQRLLVRTMKFNAGYIQVPVEFGTSELDRNQL